MTPEEEFNGKTDKEDAGDEVPAPGTEVSEEEPPEKAVDEVLASRDDEVEAPWELGGNASEVYRLVGSAEMEASAVLEKAVVAGVVLLRD